MIARPLNSLEVLKSRGDSTTLSDEEYVTLGELAVEEVRDFCTDLAQWNSISVKDGIELYDRKSELTGATENMLLAITTIPCSMEKVEKLVSPWCKYRIQWDEMLDKITIIRQIDNEFYLMRHLVKKLYVISARESIDVVKVARRDGEVVFGSTGVPHADYPPTSKSYVRTHQYLGGYVLRPDAANPDHTRFHMIFHADLNMPRLLAPVVAKFKPKLMCQKLENLKKAIDRFQI